MSKAKKLNFDILTIFPEMFPGFLGFSLTGKALKEEKIEINTHNIRDCAFDSHGSVDDTPFGGGAGMVIRPDVLGKAIDKLKLNKLGEKNSKIIYMSPKGKPLTQDRVKSLSKEENITIICGRFEGVDERVIEHYDVEEISIGDYILTGGEQAAMILIDAVTRLLPNVLGSSESLDEESFENNLLEYPQYTRPSVWNNRKVPEILTSGHHKKIDEWRKSKSVEKTKEIRPDLYNKYLDLQE